MNYNSAAIDYMRDAIAQHEEFQNLDIVDQVIAMELIEIGISLYLEGCALYTNQDPGKGKLQ